mmetsp:Transcript_17623/g.31859  ORF Transcript_17623/g.31859 Transcript_17623/m.31859 type:complete len:144 (-) Transcript_17623:149-580(-)
MPESNQVVQATVVNSNEPVQGTVVGGPASVVQAQPVVQAEPVRPVPATVVQATVIQGQPVMAGQPPIQHHMMMSTPAGVPAGSNMRRETYRGGHTMMLACLCCMCLGPLGCIFLVVPVDQREVWISPSGQKFDAFGRPIDNTF